MSDPAQQSPTPPAAPTLPVSPTTPAAAPTTPAAAATPPEQPQAWAPPGAAPFGPPAGAAPAAGAYAPPPGYAAPTGYAAAGGAASGPAAGTAAPTPGYYAPAAAPAYGPAAAAAAAAPRRGLGLVALLLALGAAVGTTAIASAVAFTVALGEPGVLDVFDIDFDWSLLTPTRGWVLLGEIAFWLGTALGIWAIVQGLIAAVTRRGRATGIVAIAVAAVGPVVFGVCVMFAMVLGATASTV